ncbi:MAG: PrpR N-terminal domain-containing protein [Desulfotomaculum sp.]|nr:PrpR N-terminal domain-containing protein [Desulfotomaculum sp.]
MIKIAFIAPYRKLLIIARDVFKEQNHHHCQLEEIMGVGFDFVKNMTTSADVILARGVTAAACRHYFKDIPVDELHVTSYDVMRAVHQIRYLKPRRVTVIGSRSMIYGADTLSDVLAVDIKTFLVEQDQQTEKVINN